MPLFVVFYGFFFSFLDLILEIVVDEILELLSKLEYNMIYKK